MNLLAVWITLGVVAICVILMWTVGSRRKRSWYKVYMANNDIRLMSRGWGERWRSNDKFPRFSDDNGHEFTFPEGAHWVLFWEHLKTEEEVNLARTEMLIRREQKMENENE